jgi:mono/diheme cytochrome c family protein
VEWILFIGAWLVVGIGVLFVAFSGGPSKAREAYLTGGRRTFAFLIVLLYIALGVAVPALVLANRGEAEGSTSSLQTKEASARLERGKQLFQSTCKSCHTLEAVNALGVTGPSLDELGEVSKERVLNAIKTGGTGQGRMPAGLLEGENAEVVAEYVAAVAGK